MGMGPAMVTAVLGEPVLGQWARVFVEPPRASKLVTRGGGGGGERNETLELIRGQTRKRRGHRSLGERVDAAPLGVVVVHRCASEFVDKGLDGGVSAVGLELGVDVAVRSG